jgi:hypothetical protein
VNNPPRIFQLGEPLTSNSVAAFRVRIGGQWSALVEPRLQRKTGDPNDLSEAAYRQLLRRAAQWPSRQGEVAVYDPRTDDLYLAQPVSDGCWAVLPPQLH